MSQCPAADPKVDSEGSLKSPPPTHTHTHTRVFKYPMKLKKFDLSETKLFHFHGIFMKNQIKSAVRNPTPLYI